MARGAGQGRAVGVGPARLSLCSGVDCGHKRCHLCRQCFIPPVKNLSDIEHHTVGVMSSKSFDSKVFIN